MIVLNVTYKCKPGMRETFLGKIREEGLDVKSRAEAGNIKYDYYFPAEEKDELLLVEKWKDADAVADHGVQPHFLRLGEIKSLYVDETIIERYEV